MVTKKRGDMIPNIDEKKKQSKQQKKICAQMKKPKFLMIENPLND